LPLPGVNGLPRPGRCSQCVGSSEPGGSSRDKRTAISPDSARSSECWVESRLLRTRVRASVGARCIFLSKSYDFPDNARTSECWVDFEASSNAMSHQYRSRLEMAVTPGPARTNPFWQGTIPAVYGTYWHDVAQNLGSAGALSHARRSPCRYGIMPRRKGNTYSIFLVFGSAGQGKLRRQRRARRRFFVVRLACRRFGGLRPPRSVNDP